ncbi:B- and T-lymphocyte attenuator B- and T-lymphocyte-associated protein Precursor [Channa argus]|uniref:B-and T-lymphocyte attenuator B-and T-lymphocyte-associated protein n=1 Tax=Channa argus TaxID=215402 RepID=A0A6G1PDU3_CHAAH|nr:B- and T-lymphocyte attenuator B- and T-lymphocyte-associated protein Precursor [Channa argus]
MVGYFLSVHIMRPNLCWIVLHVFILSVLLLNLNADSQDSDQCSPEIKVRRNTLYNVSLGEDLRISCPLTLCNNSQPTVTWYKLGKKDVLVNVSSASHIRQEWEPLQHLEGTSFLFFENILSNDSGQYRCQSGNSVGHFITISVNAVDKHHNDTFKSTTNTTTSHPYKPENLWMYIYSAAGIVVFVFIVITISIISLQGCKGKSKKETETESQYIEIPMVEQHPLHARIQPSPRGSPSAPPLRRSTRKNTPPSQPNEVPLPGDNEHVQGKATEDRGRQMNRGEEEVGGSVVYAALNHQLPARPAARPWVIQEECSEYAAIRLS